MHICADFDIHRFPFLCLDRLFQISAPSLLILSASTVGHLDSASLPPFLGAIGLSLLLGACLPAWGSPVAPWASPRPPPVASWPQCGRGAEAWLGGPCVCSLGRCLQCPGARVPWACSCTGALRGREPLWLLGETWSKRKEERGPGGQEGGSAAVACSPVLCLSASLIFDLPFTELRRNINI